jgi:hypothetical protein
VAVAFPISPELVLVAPPEEAAHARSLLPDPLDFQLEAVSPAAAAADENVRSAFGAVAVILYSGLLLAAVMFVLVAIVVHEIRFAGGL